MSGATVGRGRLLELYRTMLRIRAFENAARQLVREGLIPARFGFYTGQEAVAAGVCAHLGRGDQIGSTHRPLGHLIAKGCDLKLLMAELLGKRTGLNGGKAGPYHVFDPSVGALGANGIVGGSVPMAAGYALFHQLREDRGVSVAFFGEGASN
ncbi:MAG: thiamine pyrophosphate-dependent enzyme, partial [Candidatus Bathyarchaeia archaeon]